MNRDASKPDARKKQRAKTFTRLAAVQYGKKQLSACETPGLDAELLLSFVLRISRSALHAHGEIEISKKERAKYQALIKKRKNGVCSAYLTGTKDFRFLTLKVNNSVLVPRPETETLVEAVLDFIDQEENKPEIRFLDVCCGSGAIALAVKQERPKASVFASDVSRAALKVAKKNARLNNLKVSFIQSDVFSGISGTFDCIASNPPYVPHGMLQSLSKEVQNEPLIALDGGEDGLKIIKTLIKESPKKLKKGGSLFLEAGPEQIPQIKTLLENNRFSNIKIYKDLSSADRVICSKIY
ncbi:MAG: peptide chain release factor N(5)-glutamine methyltransferase [Spirochaetaceae bacterium]|jgi:release factor glutamine methyltransferase|nr:peptide chain release factor N(5)-glutamine methyltransferase [Spirochaetaceae bacterium]